MEYITFIKLLAKKIKKWMMNDIINMNTKFKKDSFKKFIIFALILTFIFFLVIIIYFMIELDLTLNIFFLINTIIFNIPLIFSSFILKFLYFCLIIIVIFFYKVNQLIIYLI